MRIRIINENNETVATVINARSFEDALQRIGLERTGLTWFEEVQTEGFDTTPEPGSDTVAVVEFWINTGIPPVRSVRITQQQRGYEPWPGKGTWAIEQALRSYPNADAVFEYVDKFDTQMLLLDVAENFNAGKHGPAWASFIAGLEALPSGVE
jgi:hypothetical protein